jgi:16S rRNA (cytosine1402-N4)-methyltransferase
MGDDWGHVPVLLEEAVDALGVTNGGLWVDGTFGRGGHAAAILARLGPEGRLLALDRDPEAAAAAARRFAAEPRLLFRSVDLAALEAEVNALGAGGQVRGVLLDLGVSSPQLDAPGRGFSFLRDGPLDMRMDPRQGQSAAHWLAHVDEVELDRVLMELGEERFHRRVARAIVRAREQNPIQRTVQLAELVARAVPTREQGQHPATRTFQALRLWVNQELEQLREALRQAVRVLAPGGRLAVISFHSLEDRMVKRFLRQQARGVAVPRRLPLAASETGASLRSIGRLVRPSTGECARNPRARSARLRVAERLA